MSNVELGTKMKSFIPILSALVTSIYLLLLLFSRRKQSDEPDSAPAGSYDYSSGDGCSRSGDGEDCDGGD